MVPASPTDTFTTLVVELPCTPEELSAWECTPREHRRREWIIPAAALESARITEHSDEVAANLEQQREVQTAARRRALRGLEELKVAALNRGDFAHYLNLHNAPEWAPALDAIADQIVDHQLYWKLVGSVYNESFAPWSAQRDTWARLLTAPRPHRDALMKPVDWAWLHSLPATVRVWRGISRPHEGDGTTGRFAVRPTPSGPQIPQQVWDWRSARTAPRSGRHCPAGPDCCSVFRHVGDRRPARCRHRRAHVHRQQADAVFGHRPILWMYRRWGPVRHALRRAA